jgi:carbonic anhydrase
VLTMRIGKTPLWIAAVMVLGAIFSVAQEAEPWDYSKAHGPKHWSEVNPVCGTGQTQSPINIVHPQKKQLAALSFLYQTAPVNVINNGHTIQNNYASGSKLVFEGKTYELQQFHPPSSQRNCRRRQAHADGGAPSP